MSDRLRVPRAWGILDGEIEERYPCDLFVASPDDVYWRGIDVDASPDVLFRWLCQLRVAPYSYDWIDNLGRRSPRSLTPGLDALDVGQRVMTIFRLVAFERPIHLTLVLDRPSGKKLFGEIAVTYRVFPKSPDACRLVAKLCVRQRAGLVGGLQRLVLPWGDLIMMRKQLRTLKRLAQASAHPGA